MKKLILFLAILTGVHFVNAQTSTTRGSASINIQKVESVPEEQSVLEDSLVKDSLMAEVMTTENIDLSHNKKAFTELEFESWSVYYTMMEMDYMQYTASSSEPSGRRRLNKKYVKVTHAIDSSNGYPK